MGGAPLRPIVETLPTSVPFHASALEPARRQMAARAASLTRPWDDARALGAQAGRELEPPPGVKGWSWGAFLWNWIWAIGNQTWIGLLALVPLIGLFVAIYLGIRGRELAWQNRRWDSVEHFQRVQRAWSMWGLIVLAVAVLFAVAQVALQLNRV